MGDHTEGPQGAREARSLGDTHTLLSQAAAGSADAIEALCERFRPRLVAWAHGRIEPRFRDLLATDEIVDDALLSSMRRLGTFKDERDDGFIAYLMTAVNNRILDEIRRVKRRPVKTEVPESLAAPARTPLEECVEKEDWDLYREGLSRISSEDRDIILARVELGMNLTELAIHTGRPSAAAAGMAFRRAAERLAEVMGTNGDRTPAERISPDAESPPTTPR